MLRKVISTLVLVPLAVAIVAVAVANRHAVTLSFDPLSPDKPFFTLTQPLFVILLVMLLAGVIVGGVAAWLRQRKWRRAVRRAEAEAHRLRGENETLRKQIAEAERLATAAYPAPAAMRRLPAA